MYRTNIDAVNKLGEGALIGLDCQHCRSQRASGPAPYATTTVICHSEGPCYGKILLQEHISTHQMKELKMTGKESKDKMTVDAALKTMVRELKKNQGRNM
jgi:hypothetical protein